MLFLSSISVLWFCCVFSMSLSSMESEADESSLLDNVDGSTARLLCTDPALNLSRRGTRSSAGGASTHSLNEADLQVIVKNLMIYQINIYVISSSFSLLFFYLVFNLFLYLVSVACLPIRLKFLSFSSIYYSAKALLNEAFLLYLVYLLFYYQKLIFVIFSPSSNFLLWTTW